MIKLRVVGSSNDLENLILTSKKQGRRGSHVVAIDEKLFRTLEDVVRKRRAAQKGEQQVRRANLRPKLAPREIQQLLRAGKPVDQVARLAGVDAPWIERFLGPVLDERAVAIQDSQRARLEKPRLGLSSLPLGEAVARNLRARRVRITDDELKSAWDASRSDSQPWVITLTFSYRGREQRAMWRFDPRTGEVSAANRLGSDVGWVADRRSAPSSPRPSARRTAAKPARKKAPAKKTGRKKAASKKPARKKVARKKVARKKVARKKVARKKVAKRRAPAKPRTAPKRRTTSKRRTTTKRATPKRRTTARRAAPKRRTASRRRTPKRRTR
ncbi:MAG TPA: septation protein SepH [Actinomycetota bacterium]|nr:septation protein SepH [Actinomycetota bacterium]